MEYKEHYETHVRLHKALDELLADYIATTNKLLIETSLLDLINWSHNQVKITKKEITSSP